MKHRNKSKIGFIHTTLYDPSHFCNTTRVIRFSGWQLFLAVEEIRHLHSKTKVVDRGKASRKPRSTTTISSSSSQLSISTSLFMKILLAPASYGCFLVDPANNPRLPKHLAKKSKDSGRYQTVAFEKCYRMDDYIIVLHVWTILLSYRSLFNQIESCLSKY